MKKKLNIPKDFWKDFKDRKDFDEFFSELFQEGINQMLKAEMTDHVGYEKHAKEGENSGNSRNGDYPKTLKTNLGDNDKAIHWIEECYNQRQDFFPWFKNYVIFQPLHNDPRFTEIINRIDYPE